MTGIWCDLNVSRIASERSELLPDALVLIALPMVVEVVLPVVVLEDVRQREHELRELVGLVRQIEHDIPAEVGPDHPVFRHGEDGLLAVDGGVHGLPDVNVEPRRTFLFFGVTVATTFRRMSTWSRVMRCWPPAAGRWVPLLLASGGAPSTGRGWNSTGPPVASVIRAPTGKARDTEAIRLLIRSSSQTQLRWKSGNWRSPR